MTVENNTYKVVVLALDDASNIGETSYTEAANSSERKFTVRVTNVAERGSVTVNRRYPQVNIAVTATLTDGDATANQISTATWQWYKGTTELSGQWGGIGNLHPASGGRREDSTGECHLHRQR